MCRSPGPSNNNSRMPETDSRTLETETGSREIEKRVHRIHCTLETGLHKDAPQAGGPHKGAGGLVAKCPVVVIIFYFLL